MQKNLISIVMPVKNSENYLASCLDSIIKQSDQHWELIAIDDHSFDNSYKILKSYAENDLRISIHKNNEKGIISALQMAYQYASGNIITRMDSDDIMPQNKLLCMKNALLIKGKNTIITGKVKYFSETIVSPGYINYQNWLNKICESNTHWDHLFEECVVASPAWMMFKDDFDKSYAFHSNQYPEDYELVFRWYAAGMEIHGLNELVHLWREHPKRTSRTNENYQQLAFFRLKLFYFFKLKREKERPLVIFGAGKKGKMVADLIIKNEKKFYWANSIKDDNQKVKSSKYDSYILSLKELEKLENPQIIVTAAKDINGTKINEFMESKSWKEFQHYFYFR